MLHRTRQSRQSVAKGLQELLHVVADPNDKRVPEVARACLAALGNQLLRLAAIALANKMPGPGWPGASIISNPLRWPRKRDRADILRTARRAGLAVSPRDGTRDAHGLAVAIGGDPAFHEDIEKLAMALSLTSGTQKVGEFAREAAEATLDLARIRKVWAFLFETLCFADIAAPDGNTDLNGKLAKLERYERRAFSRRKRALRAM